MTGLDSPMQTKAWNLFWHKAELKLVEQSGPEAPVFAISRPSLFGGREEFPLQYPATLEPQTQKDVARLRFSVRHGKKRRSFQAPDVDTLHAWRSAVEKALAPPELKPTKESRSSQKQKVRFATKPASSKPPTEPTCYTRDPKNPKLIWLHRPARSCPVASTVASQMKDAVDLKVLAGPVQDIMEATSKKRVSENALAGGSSNVENVELCGVEDVSVSEAEETPPEVIAAVGEIVAAVIAGSISKYAPKNDAETALVGERGSGVGLDDMDAIDVDVVVSQVLLELVDAVVGASTSSVDKTLDSDIESEVEAFVFEMEDEAIDLASVELKVTEVVEGLVAAVIAAHAEDLELGVAKVVEEQAEAIVAAIARNNDEALNVTTPVVESDKTEPEAVNVEAQVAEVVKELVIAAADPSTVELDALQSDVESDGEPESEPPVASAPDCVVTASSKEADTSFAAPPVSITAAWHTWTPLDPKNSRLIWVRRPAQTKEKAPARISSGKKNSIPVRKWVPVDPSSTRLIWIRREAASAAARLKSRYKATTSSRKWVPLEPNNSSLIWIRRSVVPVEGNRQQ